MVLVLTVNVSVCIVVLDSLTFILRCSVELQNCADCIFSEHIRICCDTPALAE